MPHPRLAFHTWPAAVYAIGDVHGCLDQLSRSKAGIAADGLDIEGEKWLVTLGDHIDRGPTRGRDRACHGPCARRASADLRCWATTRRMALDFLAASSRRRLAGAGRRGDPATPTASTPSSRRRQIAAAFPAAHRAFLETLPIYLSLPGWLFVHAGIRPGHAARASRRTHDLVWIRAPFLTSQLTGGLRVVARPHAGAGHRRHAASDRRRYGLLCDRQAFGGACDAGWTDGVLFERNGSRKVVALSARETWAMAG